MDYYEDKIEDRSKQYKFPTSMQSIINKDIRTLDAYEQEWFSKGFSIYKGDYGSLVPGTQIRYFTNAGKFCTGGWIILNNPSEGYLCYRGHRGSMNWSLQYKDIDYMYAKDKKQKKVSTKAVVYVLGQKTKFPVEIDGVVVAYARDSWRQQRMMSTRKYEQAKIAGFVIE